MRTEIRPRKGISSARISSSRAEFRGRKDVFEAAKGAFRAGCDTTRYSDKKISQKCHFFRQCFKALTAVVAITY